jgi:hypothetical protein
MRRLRSTVRDGVATRHCDVVCARATLHRMMEFVVAFVSGAGSIVRLSDTESAPDNARN